jgi:DNA-binding CsgD family transcriptional regulator
MPEQVTVVRAGADGKPRHVPLADFGARKDHGNPVAAQRILGLVRAGHSYRYIAEVGRYQGSWDKQLLDAVLASHRVDVAGSTLATELPAHARPLPVNDFERRVLDGICAGLTNTEIAEQGQLVPERVRSTARSLIRRAGARDRIALVVAVLTHATVPCPEGDHDAR